MIQQSATPLLGSDKKARHSSWLYFEPSTDCSHYYPDLLKTTKTIKHVRKEGIFAPDSDPTK